MEEKKCKNNIEPANYVYKNNITSLIILNFVIIRLNLVKVFFVQNREF